jgi:hypothetical protein
VVGWADEVGKGGWMHGLLGVPRIGTAPCRHLASTLSLLAGAFPGLGIGNPKKREFIWRYEGPSRSKKRKERKRSWPSGLRSKIP